MTWHDIFMTAIGYVGALVVDWVQTARAAIRAERQS